MNKNYNKKNAKEVENVSARLKNTKREIEQLKTNLDELINLGTRPPNPEKKPEPQIQPKKTVPVPPKRPDPVQTSSAKSKNYNVEEARDYIKKQKEKRAEQLKTQINAADTKLDLKKQKLRELHQKTLELVTKNVQSKRERSKSRDKVPPVRLDRSNPRHKPQENVQERQRRAVSSTRVKSQERQKRPVSKTRANRRGMDSNYLQPPEVNLDKTALPSQDIEADLDERIPLEASLELSKRIPQPPVSVNISSMRESRTRTRSGINPLQPLEVDLDQSALPPLIEPSPKSSKRIPDKKQELIMPDSRSKDTKETQTVRETLKWMQPSVSTFPYNFINTVKRKLQVAVNSPPCVDKGVQNSEHTPEIGKIKSKEEIKEMLLKSTSSDLRSFASHKPNLDLKTVENLGLVSGGKQNETISRNLFSGYDSESDTSKNIPEISSESLGSSSKPQLSLGKLKGLKIQKVSQEYPDYSSDFQKESLKSTSEKSSSTIKTASEKVPSISKPSTITSDNESQSKRSVIQDLVRFINTDQRGGGDSQKSFKSLLTASQISGSESEIFTSKPATESLILKEPSGSLSIRKVDLRSDVGRSLMKTITIRPAIGEQKRERKSGGSSWGSNFNVSESNGTEESVPENLDLSRDLSPKISLSAKSGALSLKEPTVSLNFGRGDSGRVQSKNITIRPATSTANNVNEIHLKFEAEVRLLNDFNESYRQFMAVEKEFENLKNKNERSSAMTKILQNVDTQTSVVSKTSANRSEKSPRDKTNTSSINFSRGSGIIEEFNNNSVLNDNRNSSKSLQNSSLSTDWNLSNLNESTNTTVSTGEVNKSKFSISNIENCNVKNYASLLSLNIFDQLIKDEDTRIQQLKAIIKIREQALLDRTKGELVWLEIQKKQLIETGKIEEASLLKKKQRGIILKHEQERNEIKKLKQMQKAVSERRKNTLKQQRNLIKSQLSTENMLSKITVKKQKERRSMGPLRVMQSYSESLHSETSISLKSSAIEDVLSITSRSYRVSEESELNFSSGGNGEDVSKAKRTLLMREAELQKRRKAAEELLRWHRKLLDEEKKIGELEAAATTVIRQNPEVRKYKFNGKQLNQLWTNMTGNEERKFGEENYVMSQTALERFCKSAREYSKNKKTKSSDSELEKSRKSTDEPNYSSVFETESVHEINSPDEKKISSISELIDNFSRIEDEISTLSRKSESIVSLKGTESVEEILTVKESEREEEKTPDSVDSTEIEESEKIIEDQTPQIQPSEEVEESEKIIEPTEQVEEPITEKSIESTIEDQEEITTIDDQKSPITSNYSKTTFEDQEPIIFRDEDTEVKVEKPELSTESSVKAAKTTVEDKEPIISQNEDLEKEEISTEIEKLELSIESLEIPSSKDLALDETLESASKIEESLTKFNEQLASEKIEYHTSTPPKSDPVLTEAETPSSSHVVTERESPPEKTPPKSESFTSPKSDPLLTEAEIDGETPSSSHVVTEIESPREKTSPKSESSTSSVETESSISTETDDKTPQKKPNQIDVKKRVSEILAEASPSRSDKSPRLQDLYVTAYDVEPPIIEESQVTTRDVEPNPSDVIDEGRQLPTNIFGSEAEELWRKQLAIEQEIKQIELQQKEQIPYVFMREIPNKPPPPYTPPSSLSSIPQSILPSDVKEITEIASYSSKVLYKAHQNSTLDKVKFSENGFKLFSKVEVTKICAEYLFNISRDIARDHYKQFEVLEEPSWLALAKKPQLAKRETSDAIGLEKILNNKLKELFGFKKVQVAESAIIKWGRKKRDHVDEVLVSESQEEESQWTNFDKDELIVKSQVHADIMKMLLEETAGEFLKILSKKKSAPKSE